jgi:nucleotide-binding universal stress UspA family protein
MPIVGDRIEVSLEAILFATDFSPSAETAKLYAEALAHRYQAQVRLIHVVDLSAGFEASDGALTLETFRKIGDESLANLKAQFLSDNLRVDTILSEAANPATGILEAAQDPAVDLLVIGTRGYKGLARLVLGSTAEQLIHQASCPILVTGPHVRPPQQTVSFQRIVYATDFSPEAAKAFVFALSFAQDFGAHLYLCHVLPADNQMSDEELNGRFLNELKRLVPDVAREWCEPECVLEHGVAADGILLLAQRVNADLIVLGTRKTSHWYNNFKTGVAFQVISAGSCPVLTVRQ